MDSWKLLDSARAPGNGGELWLYQRGPEYSIRVNGTELMNSCQHGSEEELAELACERIARRPHARVLIGGLGMGYTLSAALRSLGPDSEIVVSELVPAVVQWNREFMSHLAGDPLNDPRVLVREQDVAKIIQNEQRAWDAILLDVDNGPEGLTRKGNDWLYGINGLSSAYFALRPGGVLAVWSAAPDKGFTQRLYKIGYDVDEVRVRSRRTRGDHHVIWLAGRFDDSRVQKISRA
ncbi:MAG TPA: hypothetical protein V6D23_12555 [Candidatus Obscuribacterales bacterium]